MGAARVALETVQVAHDQERRVVQVLAIAEELLVCGDEVFMLALVLPAEASLPPYVGPAVAACGLADAAFERVPRAFRIGLGGLLLAEQLAEVEEVFMASRAFGELGGAPFGDELLWGQGICIAPSV